jgi:large subunit ribosomal protein L24
MVQFKKLRKNDTVKIVAGKDVGKSGRVLEVNREKGKILVEGVNYVKKTMRKSKKNQVGGIKDIEAFLNISNVMLICPKCKKATRVGFSTEKKAEKKSRMCKKCESVID